MDPFHIESLWRKVYGSGYSQRPDPSLMGVLSGIEIALWDILGKATGKPVYELLGGRVHERLRSYTYIYPDRPARTRASITNAELSAERAADYVKQGFTALKFDPAAPYTAFDPRQPSLEALDSRREILPAAARGGRQQGRPAVRHAWPVHRLRRHPARQAHRALRSAVVRGADAAGDAGGDGAGRARHLDPGRDRRAAHAPNTNSPACWNAAPPRSCRWRSAASAASWKPRRSPAMAETHYAQIAPHLYCGPVEGAANIQFAASLPNFLILESIETWGGFHAQLLKKPIRWEDGYVIPPTEPGLGIELNEAVALAHPYTGDRLHLEMTNHPVP